MGHNHVLCQLSYSRRKENSLTTALLLRQVAVQALLLKAAGETLLATCLFKGDS